jgi:hypothetical protein
LIPVNPTRFSGEKAAGDSRYFFLAIRQEFRRLSGQPGNFFSGQVGVWAADAHCASLYETSRSV